MDGYDFIAIDFETATSDNSSACSVGLACVKDLEIVHTEHHLIQPDSLVFGKKNIQINGITPSMVKDSPKFPEVWRKIEHYFDGSCPIVAHNASFDMSVLKLCLMKDGIDIPPLTWYCSIPITGKVCTDVGRSLEARANFLGVDVANHHNAEADAVTCAKIVISTIKRKRYKSFATFVKTFTSIEPKDFISFSPQKAIGGFREQLDYDTAITNEPIHDDGNEFENKTVVITGDFSAFSRTELSQMLINRGAFVKSGVTRKTDMLIIGKQDKTVVGEDGLSSKQEKVIAMREKGVFVREVYEDELMEMLGCRR